MSVYDFNHNEQSNNNSEPKVTSNGNQAGRHYQLENDYISRGFTTAQHQVDTSFQLNRPTSRTAMMVRQRRAELQQLHSELSCSICKGYLIDATTIDECMDSFCRSCIIIHLRNYNNCPKCGVLIHETNPLNKLRSDKVLQDIVYKLVPGLYDNEMKRRRDFYKTLYGNSSDEDDEDSSSSSLAGRCSLSGEQCGVIPHPKPFYKQNDSIDLSIEPQTRNGSSYIYYDNKRNSIFTCFTGHIQKTNYRLQNIIDSQQFKTYLRCPAKFTALQLKKFITAKFNLGTDDTIHLLYLNESLKDRYSLIDIAYIYDWRGIEPMRLYYIINRNLDKSEPIELEQHPSNGKNRQSVGTSTQFTKRVCIDPNPKFYDEDTDGNRNCNDTNNVANSSGRTMRPRVSQSAVPQVANNNINKILIKQSTTQPILKSPNNSMNQQNNLRQTHEININNKNIYNERNQNNHPNSSNFVGTISDNYRRQEGFKETRQTRKVTNKTVSCATNSIPKININLSSLQQQKQNLSTNKNYNTYSKSEANISDGHKNQIANNQLTGEKIVPYGSKQYSPANVVTTTANSSYITPSQGSMVTLASFTGSTSNHVVAMSSSAATTISSNVMSAETTTSSTFMKSDMRSTNSQMINGTPELAFSFVTERGITIIRRMNNQEESGSYGTNNHNNNTANQHNNRNEITLPAKPASNLDQQSTLSSTQVRTSGPSQSTIDQSSSTHGNDLGQGSRHNIKAKPVYKTFVDPTKLKCPNFKKYGYNPRH